MIATKVFRHGNYELRCSASATDSGAYMPVVVVSKQVWPTRPRVVAVRRGSYATEETAIAAALMQGTEWIVNYG